MNPTSWSATDVERWARGVGLSDGTILALRENEIDGPTLATLEKNELKSELGIVSLPARRYLWSLIISLRSYQGCSDRSKALDVFEEEIDVLPLYGTVINQLRSEATEQRQILSDRLMALSLESTGSQQTYEDSERARAEQDRLRQLRIQFEFDKRYALSLDRNGNERRGNNDAEGKNQIAAEFGLSIHTCINNKVNVAGEYCLLHKM